MQRATFASKLSFCRVLFASIVVNSRSLSLPFFLDRKDYLRITDDRRNTIGTYCGVQTRERVRVVATVAVLTFHSDSIVQYRGFELIFSFSPRGECRIVSTF